MLKVYTRKGEDKIAKLTIRGMDGKIQTVIPITDEPNPEKAVMDYLKEAMNEGRGMIKDTKIAEDTGIELQLIKKIVHNATKAGVLFWSMGLDEYEMIP